MTSRWRYLPKLNVPRIDVWFQSVLFVHAIYRNLIQTAHHAIFYKFFIFHFINFITRKFTKAQKAEKTFYNRLHKLQRIYSALNTNCFEFLFVITSLEFVALKKLFFMFLIILSLNFFYSPEKNRRNAIQKKIYGVIHGAATRVLLEKMISGWHYNQTTIISWTQI